MIVLVLAATLVAPPATGIAVPKAATAAAAPSAAPGVTAASDAAGGHASAAPADTATRVPGSWMRIGYTHDQVLARASFPLKEGQTPRGVVVRRGSVAWFGLPSEATLHFREDRLESVEFLVEDAAPHWADYLHDQLRLAGYRARCERDEPGLRICDWLGASLVRLELRERRLLATISAAEPAPEARIAGPGSPPSARRDTVPLFPQVFVLGRAAPPGAPAAPALADSTPLVAPAYPPAAREAGVQGRVWVRALVDTNGAVEATEIARGIPELDSAAVAVVLRCRFRPYEPAGAAVRFRIEIPVIFMVR